MSTGPTGPTGPLGYISAGRYEQTGGTLNIIGPTGSIISTVSAVEINVSGTLSANVVNANTLNYDNLDLSGNLTVGGTISTGSGFIVDESGNVTVSGDLVVVGEEVAVQGLLIIGDLATASGFLVDTSGDVLVPGNLGIAGALESESGFSVDVSGNAMVPGTITTESGFTIDNSGNVMVPGTITTESGFTIDNSGNVMVPGLFSTQSGLSVDLSGNLVVPGSSVLTGYVTTNAGVNINLDLAVDQNVTVLQNAGITGQMYLGGNMYSNNGVTVGDSLNGNGVAINVAENLFDLGNNTGMYVGYVHSSDYIDASGVHVDASGIPTWTNPDIYPKVALNVNGNIWADQGIYANTGIIVDPLHGGYALANTVDSSGTYFIDLSVGNGSQPIAGAAVATHTLPILINGIIYNLLLNQ